MSKFNAPRKLIGSSASSPRGDVVDPVGALFIRAPLVQRVALRSVTVHVVGRHGHDGGVLDRTVETIDYVAENGAPAVQNNFGLDRFPAVDDRKGFTPSG